MTNMLKEKISRFAFCDFAFSQKNNLFENLKMNEFENDIKLYVFLFSYSHTLTLRLKSS